MHELSVCHALIGQVERVAREHDARRVVSIVIAVGPLSGVEAALLEHAYPIAAAGSVAEHATLTVETVPVEVSCRGCGARTPAQPNRLVCGACADWQVEVVAGEEMLLKRVEIETEPEPVHAGPVH
jgi:hydrogenase nickel incorporation protein HypA/HybF